MKVTAIEIRQKLGVAKNALQLEAGVWRYEHGSREASRRLATNSLSKSKQNYFIANLFYIIDTIGKAREIIVAPGTSDDRETFYF